MNSQPNQSIYRYYAPIYDRIFRPIFHRARARAIQCLELQAGEKLLIPGAGTGLDLPMIPTRVRVTALDIQRDMLKQSLEKTLVAEVDVVVMDAQKLAFKRQYFDAVLFNLSLSVIPDARQAFLEAWRLLHNNGRVVIFDKFLPSGSSISNFRRGLGRLISAFGTDPNRRLEDIIDGIDGLEMDIDEPDLFHGQYRIIRLHKTSQV